MIRINLLPIRELKKREKLQREVLAFFGAIGAAILIMILAFLAYQNQITELEKEQKLWTTEKAKYSKTMKKMKDLENKKKELEERIQMLEKRTDAIVAFEQERVSPILLVEILSQAIPTGKVWFEKISLKDTTVDLQGKAEADPSVAEMVDNLRKYSIFKDVKIKQSVLDLDTFRESLRRIMNFTITCELNPNVLKQEKEKKSETEEDTKSSKKKK